MSLARSSSERCAVGMKRHPSISARVLTMGGPPSSADFDSKNREMEKVLQGGAARMTAKSPRTILSRSASYTSSLVMSALAPPPVLALLSKSSTSSPSLRANWAKPSGRRYAPEKSRRTRVEVPACDLATRVAEAKDSGSEVSAAGSRGVGA